MSRVLFAPDMFSRPHPVFHPVREDIRGMVSDVLQQHYGFEPRSLLTVEALEGLEVNSRNFRLTTTSGFLALKRVKAGVDPGTFSVQLAVAEILKDQGVPVPRVFKSCSNFFCASDETGRMWVLSEFVNGDYYSGDMQGLLAVVSSISCMQSKLEGLRQAQDLPLASAVQTWSKTASVLEELLRRETEWSDLFPPSESHILAAERRNLQRALITVSAHQKQIRTIVAPAHNDIHPHNILIPQHGRAVIVDIDSLQRTNRIQSLAFGIFKILRQHVVCSNPKDMSKPLHLFLEGLGMPAREINNYRLSAMAEVLRRIAIIADLNMNKANRDWNAVLNMQLTALHEIPHIFGPMS